MKKIVIYTDGACSFNPGPGGWGAILFYKNHKKEISGGEKQTTNNKMELTAVVEALKLVKEKCYIDIYSDSAYIVNAFQNGWVDIWQKENWQNSQKKTVANKELWEKLIDFTKKHSIKWHKVKGHSNNAHNNRCDELARQEVEKILKVGK